MEKVLNGVKAFIKDEEGVTSIEYALLAALIALVMAAGASLLGTSLSTFFGKIATALDGYSVPGTGGGTGGGTTP